MDESGQVIGVQPEDTSYPHTIIEMFMVEANVAVAVSARPLLHPVHAAYPSRARLRRPAPALPDAAARSE